MLEREIVADVAQVYELWREVSAAMSDGDTERWIALWSDDGVQMPPGAPRRDGIAEIRKAMISSFHLWEFRDVTVQAEEIRILGDWATSYGVFALTITPKEGGETRRCSGKFLDVLRKQADGSWKIALECFNYEAPAELYVAPGALHGQIVRDG